MEQLLIAINVRYLNMIVRVGLYKLQDPINNIFKITKNTEKLLYKYYPISLKLWFRKYL